MSQILKWTLRAGAAAALVVAVSTPRVANAQVSGYYDQSARVETLDAGSQIPIRLTEPINVTQPDNRIFTCVVDRDVFAEDGRLVISEGEPARLIVTVGDFNDLILRLQSVNVNGQPYFVRTDRNRIDYQPAGMSMGAITGTEARGQALRLPSFSVLSFSLDRPLEIGMH